MVPWLAASSWRPSPANTSHHQTCAAFYIDFPQLPGARLSPPHPHASPELACGAQLRQSRRRGASAWFLGGGCRGRHLAWPRAPRWSLLRDAASTPETRAYILSNSYLQSLHITYDAHSQVSGSELWLNIRTGHSGHSDQSRTDAQNLSYALLYATKYSPNTILWVIAGGQPLMAAYSAFMTLQSPDIWQICKLWRVLCH